jgi:hypothetical protein
MRKKAQAAALIALVCTAAIIACALLWHDGDAPQLQPVDPPLSSACAQAPDAGGDQDEPAAPTAPVESFPDHRIRMVKDDAHFPDPYYTDNRVILSKVELASTGAGMQISGTVLTDFDADRVPASETGIQPGQQTVSVEIELVQFDTVLKRNQGVVVDPNPVVNNRAVYRPIQGQGVTVRVTGTMPISAGEVGRQDFVLPAMAKPLAPGIYALVARVHFRSQPQNIQKAIQWCSDWYGHAHKGGMSDSPDTNKSTFARVMDDPELHEFYYEEIMNFVGKVESSCLLYVGRTLQGGSVELRSPGSEAPNCVLWAPMHAAAQEIMDWEHDHANADRIVQQELEQKRSADRPAGMWASEWAARMRRWESLAESDAQLIRRMAPELITRYGGATTEGEREIVRAAQTAKPVVLEQICRFQEGLVYQYWVLVTGHFNYGVHEVNHPGYQVWDAMSKDDMKPALDQRLARLAEIVEQGERKWRQVRDEKWRLVPPEIREVAFHYLDRKVESDVFDPQHFCELKDGRVVLAPTKWAEYRRTLFDDLHRRTAPMLGQITTTNTYANQVWPLAQVQADRARDAVITLAYAWEFHTRTEAIGEKPQAVEDDWTAEAKRFPKLNLERYYRHAQASPGSVAQRLADLMIEIKKAVGVFELERAYQEALKAGANQLPGKE